MKILRLFSERFMEKIERKRKNIVTRKNMLLPYKNVTRKMHVNVSMFSEVLG